MKGARGAVGFTEQGSHSVQALGGSAALLVSNRTLHLTGN